ncbi:hypothetical protein, partial [Bacillus licheniformis]|uniref:hypothetical protein n=1 Tax=Bacillus licheniformis TaxID=1402 RepID=UPI001642487B
KRIKNIKKEEKETEMHGRQGFRMFMRFELEKSVGEEMGVCDAEIDKIIVGIEDDHRFYDQLDHILKGHTEDSRVNYG